jgi:hypothetical protein
MTEKVYQLTSAFTDPVTGVVYSATTGPGAWRVIHPDVQARFDALPASQCSELTALRGIPAQITELSSMIEAAAAGYIFFATKSAIDADLAHDAGAIGRVYGDSTAAYNGDYVKSGASGAGSWAKTTYQPASALDLERNSTLHNSPWVHKSALDGTFSIGTSGWTSAAKEIAGVIKHVTMTGRDAAEEYYIGTFANDDATYYDRITVRRSSDNAVVAYSSVAVTKETDDATVVTIPQSGGSGLTATLLIDYRELSSSGLLINSATPTPLWIAKTSQGEHLDQRVAATELSLAYVTGKGLRNQTANGALDAHISGQVFTTNGPAVEYQAPADPVLIERGISRMVNFGAVSPPASGYTYVFDRITLVGADVADKYILCSKYVYAADDTKFPTSIAIIVHAGAGNTTPSGQVNGYVQVSTNTRLYWCTVQLPNDATIDYVSFSVNGAYLLTGTAAQIGGFAATVHADPLTLYDMRRDDWYWDYDGPKVAYLESSVTLNTWLDKDWGTEGDSITAQGRWQPTVVSKLGLNLVENYGVSGTLVSGTGTTAMNNDARVDAIDNTLDVLNLQGGTNDWIGSVALGAEDSVDVSTFNGALNVWLTKIITRLPSARVFLHTIPYGSNVAKIAGAGWADAEHNTLGLTTKDYSAAIMAAGARFGVPVIDLNGEMGTNSINQSVYYDLEPSPSAGAYVHPKSGVGGERLAEVVVGVMQRLAPTS